MGILVNGQWIANESDLENQSNITVGPYTIFEGKISKDPDSEFVPEEGRYHLYVSKACPWANRALIMRKLKKLEAFVTVSTIFSLSKENGWEFDKDSGPNNDPLYNSNYLYELYIKSHPNYTGRVSVPILWDKKTQKIISKESSDIIVMFNEAFEGSDFYPLHLRPQIDEINAYVLDKISSGVYKAGFAIVQEIYEKAFVELFEALDVIEKRLSEHRFLVGNEFTIADVRLFTTLVRFDAVYFGHFKCNLRRIADYHNLQNYLRDLFQMQGVGETVDISAIKMGYYGGHGRINPNRIVPKGPLLTFNDPHDRLRFVS